MIYLTAEQILFLHANGYHFQGSNTELENFTLEIARSEHTIEEIAVWLQINARLVDKAE